jgi:hypothetical protein
MAAPDVEAVPSQMFPGVDTPPHPQAESLTLQTLMPGECVVGCTNDDKNNNGYYGYWIVTNLCRLGRSPGNPNDRRSYPTQLTGDPLPMSHEYIEIMKAVSGNVPTCPFTPLLEKYKAFNPHVEYTVQTQEMLRDAARKLEQAEGLRDTNERQLAEVAEGRKAVAAGQAANDKEKASLVKRMQRVAKRERSVEVGEQLTAVRAQLETAGTELLDACDTVEKDLVGRSIAAALEALESVKRVT